MPSENEELDVFKNRRWRPFVNLLRGSALLDDETILREFDRRFIQGLRRVFRVLKVSELIIACVNGDAAEINRLRQEHRQQRDRAETFADQIVQSCQPGASYPQAVDAFIHSACARIIDQAALAVMHSDNFPTIEDYRQASAIWLFRMEGRIHHLVEQIVDNPSKLRVQRESPQAKRRRMDQELSRSLLDRPQS